MKKKVQIEKMKIGEVKIEPLVALMQCHSLLLSNQALWGFRKSSLKKLIETSQQTSKAQIVPFPKSFF